MAQRTVAFELPSWRAPGGTNLRTGVLLIGTLLWLGLYGRLGSRLLAHGIGGVDRRDGLLMVLTVAFGVMTVVGWRQLWPQWQARWNARRFGDWRALSVKQLQALTPSEFEDYVAERIFERQGYRVENTPDVKDGGVDILVRDRFGNLAVVQCKRYRGTVGAATLRDLYGTMLHTGATHAYLVTSGRISRDAREWVRGKPIGLIDGARLVKLAEAEPHTFQPPGEDGRIEEE
ncbi:MAG: restriction endonuclease [Caldilineaceae bacterium]|nr:restriction endonuclease [Caldilineaceae bacterium]